MNLKKGRMPPKPWKPGEAPYADFLKTLDPEQYAAHHEKGNAGIPKYLGK